MQGKSRSHLEIFQVAFTQSKRNYKASKHFKKILWNPHFCPRLQPFERKSARDDLNSLRSLGFFFFLNYALLADAVIYTFLTLQNIMWNDTTRLYSPLQTYETPDRLYKTWHQCHANGSHATRVILSPITNNMAATNSMETKLSSLNVQPQNLMWQ